VSGVISALEPGVTGLGVGDEVFGLIDFDRNGAAADYVTVPAAHLAASSTSPASFVSSAASGVTTKNIGTGPFGTKGFALRMRGSGLDVHGVR
jgi:NADPH:quinone reductase-like Zn-dependent oxidoreductase